MNFLRGIQDFLSPNKVVADEEPAPMGSPARPGNTATDDAGNAFPDSFDLKLIAV